MQIIDFVTIKSMDMLIWNVIFFRFGNRKKRKNTVNASAPEKIFKG